MTETLIAEKLHNLFTIFNSNGVDARLVGSLARAAVYNRRPKMLSQGGGSDIDVTFIGNERNVTDKLLQEGQDAVSPFRLDRHGQGKITQEGGQTFIHYKDISLPVDNQLFTLREGSVLSTTVPTFNPNTLFHLTTLYGPIRPKDWNSLLAFAREMRQVPDCLPEELFEPFHQLADQRRQDYPFDTFLGNARWEYHKRVPYETRVALSKAFVGTARRLVTSVYGWIEPPHA